MPALGKRIGRAGRFEPWGKRGEGGLSQKKKEKIDIKPPEEKEKATEP